MKLTVKLEGLEEARRMFDPKLVDRAARTSINAMAKSSKSEGSKVIREQFNLRKADVDRKVKLSLAKGSNLEAVLTVRDSSIGLLNFGATWTRGTQVVTRPRQGELKTKQLKRAGRNQGVSAKIRRTGGKTLLPKAFIARGARGAAGRISASTAQVFVRGSRGLIPKRIPSVATLFEREKTFARIVALVNTRWARTFAHEIDRLIKGIGGRR